jgi:hypothetical protein
MSKFFKYLGIGSAIGVIAYGVIKYKNDQKFKEKVDEVSDKVKEKADKVMTKASNFAADHPILTTAAFAAAVFVPIIALRNAMEPTIEHYQNIVESVIDDSYDEECERINETAADTAKRIISEHYGDDNVDLSNYLVVPKDEYEKYQKAYETKAEPETEENPRGWKEDYREKWDKVNEFAKTLDLVDGESFWIDEPSQYDAEANEPIVSHMIYGESCYPPEES